jgi:Tripartite tricarboxylate transporter TctB family
MKRDFICAAVLLAIATGYFTLASGIGRSALADEVGPTGLPFAYAVLLATLAITLALKTGLRYSLGRRARGPAAADGPTPTFVLARASGTLAIGVGYVVVVNLLGYWLSLVLLLLGMARYQGEMFSRRLLLISVAGATVFWLLFAWLLGIPMPGPWLAA